jgi:1,4-alpha-glucan branching enzyme
MRFWKSPWRKLLAPVCLLVFAAAIAGVGGGRSAVPPLGATPQKAGTTFRVWAPFVDSVAVKVNGGKPVALKKEAGHPAAEDAVWVGNVEGAKAGDRYTYVITANGTTGEFIDPRSRQLTGPGRDAASVIVDTTPTLAQFKQPSFNTLVIYELHIGTFNVPSGKKMGTFTDAIARLDHLKGLGINAVEVMPVHENARREGQMPPEFNWGYDATQLYAVNSAYGTPADCKAFIKACHERQIAVILDVVYNHLVDKNLLVKFGGVSGPGFKDGIFFYGDDRGNTGFGPRPDFGRPQVRAYIEDNALMWLREYGVDGLRWDSTINIRAFNNGANKIKEGEDLLRQFNNDYRKTDPQKISIAEDLTSSSTLVAPTAKDGFGFNSQWDDKLWAALRRAVIAVNDKDRNLDDLKKVIEQTIGSDAFGKVIYTENHDKVGHPKDDYDGRPQIRLPALIDVNNNASVFAKRRSTLAAAIMLTSPGIPMLFQGQEMLENRAFDFFTATPMDWGRVERFKGIVKMYRDLIALRRNLAGKTGGLTSQHVKVFHKDDQKKTLAYHRYGKGGPGDDVVVVVNLSNQTYKSLTIGLPRAGKWAVRFNSGAAIYDPEFKDGVSFDTTANPGARDGLNFTGEVGIGPYSVVILSQG